MAASVNMWPVRVRLHCLTLYIPALPASQWLPALVDTVSGDPWATWRLGDSTAFDDAIMDGKTTDQEMLDVTWKLIETATGRSIQNALGLTHVAMDRWDAIGGDLARRGVQWDRISIAAGLDAIYGSITQLMKPEDLPKLHNALNRPLALPGKAKDKPWGDIKRPVSRMTRRPRRTMQP